MELQDVIETAGTCRRYTDDPVDHSVLLRVLDAARYAPTGANRQGVRLIAVTDTVTRRALGERYLAAWEASLSEVRAALGDGPLPRTIAEADHFARHFAEVPVLIVVCAVLDDLLPTDASLDRVSIAGGASVYPAVQNLLLKCRDVGLGAALTTNLCQFEPEVKVLLGIPDDVATAATIAVGHPARPFPRVLSRRPVEEIAYVNRYGRAIAAVR